MFRDWFGKKAVPLRGAPPVRRIKSYSAQSGYVYQYSYEGQRPAAKEGGVEFAFLSSADRKSWHAVRVVVDQSPVTAWERAHGRTLCSNEWYALAKMSLFAAFDARATPAEMHSEPVCPQQADIDEIMERLGIE
ncbi:MAG TPA: hypothetical protein VNV86_00565 [Candidatus Acidoferrum sp.]|nr:hypothetical protein [Candidatus Acidoferrum sp.]